MRGATQLASPGCGGGVLNPLQSEEEAFRLLLYAIVVFGVIIALILIVRAIF